MIHYYERKWSPIEERSLCRRCLETKSDFVGFFKRESIKGICFYCKRKVKVADINILIEFIADSIHSAFEDPVENLPYESREEGYMGAEIYDTEDLFDQLIRFERDDVRKDILSAFDLTAQWCEKDPFQDRASDQLKYSWRDFSDTIKYKVRYFFPRPKKARVSKIHKNGPEYPGDILSAISKIAKDLHLFVKLKKGDKVYRARRFSAPQTDIQLNDIGVCPARLAKSSNRLSPAGIPIFYGSFSVEHLKDEVRVTKHEEKYLVIGEFSILKEVLVLDLTKIPTPSIFSEDDRDKREAIIFLSHFKREIMQVVEPDGSEHIEYVPSQVFSEFIRLRCDFDGKKILGIKYPSVPSSNSAVNIALFISNDHIGDILSIDEKKDCVLDFHGMKQTVL